MELDKMGWNETIIVLNNTNIFGHKIFSFIGHLGFSEIFALLNAAKNIYVEFMKCR